MKRFKDKCQYKMKHNNAVETMIVNAGLAYEIDGNPGQGTVTVLPYMDKTIIGRVFREVWFRLGLPERAWYNKEILNYSPKRIIVKDSLITTGFLTWLKRNFPDIKISYSYDNLIAKAKNLTPDRVPEGISMSTYDPGDSRKYGIELTYGQEFPRSYILAKLPIEYDVFYVGADKGRGDYLVELRNKMEAMGLKTKFIITKDGRLSRNKEYYSRRISYSETLEYDRKSRAIINIIMPGQEGPTRRDFEAIFLKCKLITNNRNIKDFDFYEKENVFIIGEDDFFRLPAFVRSAYKEIDDSILASHVKG